VIPRPSISRRAAAVAIAGCFAALVLVPLAIEGALLATDPDVARSLVGVFGSLLALVVVALVGRRLLTEGLAPDAAVPPLVEETPERGGDEDDVLAGAALRDGVERAAGLREEGIASSARESVWTELRSAAALAERRATGASLETARERVAAGEWTDDAVVGTFLAAPDADVSYPTRHVLYEWLTPGGAFERRAERAAEVVAERYEASGRAGIASTDRLPPVEPVASDDAPTAATAVLGAELAAAVERAADDGVAALPTTDETALRDGLRAAAIAAVDRDPDAEGDARRTVRNGEWTDDDVAAAFLSDAAAAADPPLLDLVHAAIDPSGALDRRVSRAASAVLDRCESLSIDDRRRGDAGSDSSGAGRVDRPADRGGRESEDAGADADSEGGAEDADSEGGGAEDAGAGSSYRWPDDVSAPAERDDEQAIHDAPVGKRR